MTAAALLAEAEDSGVRLRLDDDRIAWRGRPTTELLARLRARKLELLALLRGDACRHCGTAIYWLSRPAVAYADGWGAHLECYERAAINARA